MGSKNFCSLRKSKLLPYEEISFHFTVDQGTFEKNADILFVLDVDLNYADEAKKYLYSIHFLQRSKGIEKLTE